jgi:hypothetical protein
MSVVAVGSSAMVGTVVAAAAVAAVESQKPGMAGIGMD